MASFSMEERPEARYKIGEPHLYAVQKWRGRANPPLDASSLMRVYKFLPAKFAIEGIKKRRLKISTFEDMNDPFELSGLQVYPPIVLQSWLPYIRQSFGAISFTRTWTDPVLWAHYAEQHKGICLVFEMSQVELTRTRYVVKKETYDATRLVKKLIRMIGSPNQRAQLWAMSGGSFRRVMNKILSVKYKSWGYEKETRVFTTLKDKEHGLYFMKFGRRMKVVEVILGHRCEQSDRAKMKRALKPYASSITLSQAIPSSAQFMMRKHACA